VRAFRDAGLRVPEDVSVVGFDDIQAAAYLIPRLTTVRQPLRQMGEMAAKQLLMRISNGKGKVPQLISLAPENHALAIEVATLPRVRKGYGDTHIRGCKSFDAMMSTISSLRGRDDGADCLKRLREAALADESGEKLDATLHEVNA